MTPERPKNKAAQALGRSGGQVKSRAKTESARKNARKGGWPKGKPRKKPPLTEGKASTKAMVSIPIAQPKRLG